MSVVFDPQIFTVVGGTRTARKGGAHKSNPFVNVRWTSPIVRRVARSSPAKRAGLMFERKVVDVLTAIYGASFTPAPTIQYVLRGARKAAILDGMLRLNDELIIIEVKIRHTAAVWEQLMERYLPLVGILEPHLKVRTVEICRTYDPAIILPGPHRRIESLHKTGCGLEVLEWKI